MEAQKLSDYHFEQTSREEVLAGRPSIAKWLLLFYKNERIGSIKYEMRGKELVIWNRLVKGTPEERKARNQAFSTVPENKDKRSLGDEILFQAIQREHAKAVATPHQTRSSKDSFARMRKKFGIKLASRLPKKVPMGLIRRR